MCDVSAVFRSGSVEEALSGCLALESAMFTETTCPMDSEKLTSKFLSSVW